MAWEAAARRLGRVNTDRRIAGIGVGLRHAVDAINRRIAQPGEGHAVVMVGQDRAICHVPAIIHAVEIARPLRNPGEDARAVIKPIDMRVSVQDNARQNHVGIILPRLPSVIMARINIETVGCGVADVLHPVSKAADTIRRKTEHCTVSQNAIIGGNRHTEPDAIGLEPDNIGKRALRHQPEYLALLPFGHRPVEIVPPARMTHGAAVDETAVQRRKPRPEHRAVFVGQREHGRIAGQAVDVDVFAADQVDELGPRAMRHNRDARRTLDPFQGQTSRIIARKVDGLATLRGFQRRDDFGLRRQRASRNRIDGRRNRVNRHRFHGGGIDGRRFDRIDRGRLNRLRLHQARVNRGGNGFQRR